jgi:chorismate synthase
MVAAGIAAPREMRGQTPRVADKEQAQRTRSKEILEDIKKLKDSYGQDKSRDSKAIPYGIAARLFQKMEDWIRDACVNDAS